ncbi:hypothetical protein ANAPH2_01308 [Anaplasma phagocytophilum]|nr:hypothetical protein ANAPH2_00918 [Anaplasma phagocytophilum]SCV65571.1 hypothetical protein ANAPH2_01308 [Anaplasma phagocytophilum]
MDSVKIKLVDDLGLYPSIPRVLYKTIQRSIIREYEADTVYLLAKELAYDVVTGQTDKLSAALAKTSGKDFVQFAKTLGISHSDIDGKVCKTKPKSGAADNFGKYGAKSDIATDSTTTLCAGEGHTSGGTGPQYLRDFVEKTLKEDGNGNWPTSTAKAHDKKPTPETNDNARAVAGDLTKLTPEEKTIVAGLLARTIEGGEVIEIRAVSSTSVMVNAEFEIIRLFRRESSRV